jgi:hypothetical protein
MASSMATWHGQVENPKSEARNPKQYPMVKIRAAKTAGAESSF